MTTETPVHPVPAETRPLEPTTPIRPSEAIRLGCLIAPVQAFDTFGDGERRACAIGAAALGWGIDEAAAQAQITIDLGFNEPCPAGPSCGHYGWPAILNDAHRWSRERIADWLAELGL